MIQLIFGRSRLFPEPGAGLSRSINKLQNRMPDVFGPQFQLLVTAGIHEHLVFVVGDVVLIRPNTSQHRTPPRAAYRGLLEVEKCIGAKHSPLSRALEWERGSETHVRRQRGVDVAGGSARRCRRSLRSTSLGFHASSLARERTAKGGGEAVVTGRASAEHLVAPRTVERLPCGFVQSYRSARYKDLVRKRMSMVREDGGWKIAAEFAEP